MEPAPTSLREFLAWAEAERTALEAALEDARRRRATAESLARSEAQRADRLGSELDDLTRHLDEERRATWHEVQAVLAEAEVEAATILASARAEADEILDGTVVHLPNPGPAPESSFGRAVPASARTVQPGPERLVG